MHSPDNRREHFADALDAYADMLIKVAEEGIDPCQEEAQVPRKVINLADLRSKVT